MIEEDYNEYEIDSTKIEPYQIKRKTELLRVGTDLSSSFESSQRVYSTNGISPCFTTSFNGKFFDTKNQIFRTLTEKEMSSIQGIPEDFKFPVKKTSIRKQVGNSMTVEVLEGLFTELMVGYYDLEEPINNTSYNVVKELVC